MLWDRAIVRIHRSDFMDIDFEAFGSSRVVARAQSAGIWYLNRVIVKIRRLGAYATFARLTPRQRPR